VANLHDGDHDQYDDRNEAPRPHSHALQPTINSSEIPFVTDQQFVERQRRCASSPTLEGEGKGQRCNDEYRDALPQRDESHLGPHAM
jgi:hypothetical protein